MFTQTSARQSKKNLFCDERSGTDCHPSDIWHCVFVPTEIDIQMPYTYYISRLPSLPSPP